MKNRRPKLKRKPVLADRVAEIVRDAADKLDVRVNVRVILYKRGQDLVIATIPEDHYNAVWEAACVRLIVEGFRKRVTLKPYQHQFEVWLSMGARSAV